MSASGIPAPERSETTSRKIPTQRAESFFLVGEGLDQAVRVGVPALGAPELEVGEDEGVEAVRVHLDELDPVVEPDALEDLCDVAGLDATDVMEADVELPLLLAAEGLAAAAGDVVLLEHEDLLAIGGEVGGRGQAAEAGTDHDRVPGSGALHGFGPGGVDCCVYTHKSDYTIS